MCQFLLQRAQQDMAGFYGTSGGLGMSSALRGGASYATISGVLPHSLVETSAAAQDEDEDEDEQQIDEEDSDQDEVEDEDEMLADDEDEVEVEDEDEQTDEEEVEDEDTDEIDEEDTALLQIDDESDEDESEEEADESEEASEDGQAAGDWQEPEYNNNAAPAPTVSLLETDTDTNAGEQFQTPQYIDTVYQEQLDANEAEAEAETEVEARDGVVAAESAAGTADMAEPAFFESGAIASRGEDESDSEWATPEYTSEKADTPIPTPSVLLETSTVVGEEAQDQSETETEAAGSVAEAGAQAQGWTTPVYTDSAAPSQSSGKHYARIVPTVQPQSLLEASAHESAVSSANVELVVPRMIASLPAAGADMRFRRRSARKRRVGSAYTPRRYHPGDRLFVRPIWNRMSPHHHQPTAQRIEATRVYELATHVAYDNLEGYCSTRLPEMYGKFCRPILRQFRIITEGLRYGDRIEQVCMNIKLCPRKSYVRQRPHALANRN